MQQLTKNKHGLKQRGNVKDGSVDFVDDAGKVKERIIFGEL